MPPIKYWTRLTHIGRTTNHLLSTALHLKESDINVQNQTVFHIVGHSLPPFGRLIMLLVLDSTQIIISFSDSDFRFSVSFKLECFVSLVS